MDKMMIATKTEKEKMKDDRRGLALGHNASDLRDMTDPVSFLLRSRCFLRRDFFAWEVIDMTCDSLWTANVADIDGLCLFDRSFMSCLAKLRTIFESSRHFPTGRSCPQIQYIVFADKVKRFSQFSRLFFAIKKSPIWRGDFLFARLGIRDLGDRRRLTLDIR